MNILVTGSAGFVGQNLVWNLKEIRDGKNRTRPGLQIDEIYEYDINTPKTVDTSGGVDSSSDDETARSAFLRHACENADFVFNLAGVNRPKDTSEFMTGNADFASELLDTLKSCGNTCPVLLSSSIQATLMGRFAGSEYGKSKLAGEEVFFRYGEETGARVLVYRFPNLFGKWCRPNYNSAVATFCNAVANDLDYTVNDPNTELELLYIDDLVAEMLDALEGREHRCEYSADGKSGASDELAPVPKTDGRFCYVPTTHHVTLGEIVEDLQLFKSMPQTLMMPAIPDGSFIKKLYSTYLSYLPKQDVAYDLKSNTDERGSFTELIRTGSHGQVSVNITKPGVTKGEHWHNSKWEIFIVVSGRGLIKERRIGTDPATGRDYPVTEYEVDGEHIRAVQMLPGYTHSITNLSDTDDLVTIMWANELFDDKMPDTFREQV